MERNQDRKSTAALGKTKPAAASQARSSQTTTETSPGSQGPSLSPSRKSPGNVAGSMVAPVPPQDDGSREARIAREAYYRAERRGFQPGQELDDWLEAEKALDKDKAH